MLNQNRRAGAPAAPRVTSLVLLPLGPDTVRRFLPRRTHPAVGKKDTSCDQDCQLLLLCRKIALVMMIVTKMIAPIVIPKVVFPVANNPLTGLVTFISVICWGEAAAAKLIQKKVNKPKIRIKLNHRGRFINTDFLIR